jgi:hypothetical protein
MRRFVTRLFGTKAPTRELDVNGRVRLNTVVAQPTCDATVR